MKDTELSREGIVYKAKQACEIHAGKIQDKTKVQSE